MYTRQFLGLTPPDKLYHTTYWMSTEPPPGRKGLHGCLIGIAHDARCAALFFELGYAQITKAEAVERLRPGSVRAHHFGPFTNVLECRPHRPGID